MPGAKNILRPILYFVFGGVFGALVFFQAVFLASELWEFYYFSLLGNPRYSNTDDFLVIFVFIMPAALLGSFTGGLSGILVNRRKPGRWLPILSACGGGILGSFVVALVLSGYVVSGWASYYDDDYREVYGKQKPIPSLMTSYQDLFTFQDPEQLAVSNSGTLLAIAADGEIFIRDLELNEPVGAVLSGHTSTINALDFGPDDRLLVSGSHDQSVRVWNIETGEQVATLNGHSAAITSASFHPDGKIVASGDIGGEILLWDLETPEVSAHLTGFSGHLYSLSFSPDGRILAVGGSPDIQSAPPISLVLWDVESKEQVGELKMPDYVMFAMLEDLSFSPDGQIIAGAMSTARLVTFWDVNTRSVIGSTTAMDTLIHDVSYSRDGNLLVASGLGKLYVWDPTSRILIGSISDPSSDMSWAEFLQDGLLLGYNHTTEGMVRVGIWKIENLP